MNTANLLGYAWFPVAFAANLIVFGFAVQLYAKSKRRMLIPLFLSSGLNAVTPFVPWTEFGESGVQFSAFLFLASAALWTIAMCLVLRELAGVWSQPADTQRQGGQSPT